MNGRKARQRAAQRKQRDRGALAAMRAATPRLMRRQGAMEAWRVGPVTVIVPALFDHYPQALTAAIEVQRKAAFTGACACGAQGRITAAGQVRVDHAAVCLAGDWLMAVLADDAGVPHLPAPRARLHDIAR